MPQIPIPSATIRGYQYVLENNFTGGLKTEFTSLNFPENACTSTSNCTFFHTGAVFRRNGFDYELNNVTSNIARGNVAISSFVWTNVGGDGNTKVYVLQVGNVLYFYQITNATVAAPLSTTKLASTVSLDSFIASGGSTGSQTECQYAAGNGYLFVFNSNLDPFYCSFSAGVVTGNIITVKIRDFLGMNEPGISVTNRPGSSPETDAHHYNLYNQGWNDAQINTFFTAVGQFPSRADQWWSFKNSTGTFAPATTVSNVNLNNSPAPNGFFVLTAFDQEQPTVSTYYGQPAFTVDNTKTTVRPRTGSWFQGRVWYAGVDASIANSYGYYTWTESIYFSQIIENPTQFGNCYQENDPTGEVLFDILPSDGGVITIQGSGSIYKLFPITNGLLVFAANGIWFITGSTGIGFTATDYTITKLSAVQSISSTSYVDVLGYPMFWNEEGIYSVGIKSEQQGLSVDTLTLNTIKQFYDAIPIKSKKAARGAYNPITGQVQWLYRSTNEPDLTSRYQFDSVLTLSMFTQAFYPWSISSGNPNGVNTGPFMHDIAYIVGPGGSTSPLPGFKYITSNLLSGNYKFTFSEERDSVNWKDWVTSGSPVDYKSYFVTGYRLHGDAQRKWQPGYVYVYSDNAANTSYLINGKWNYAISGASGKYSSAQLITNSAITSQFSKQYRRVRIRGHGTVLQLQIASVSGQPFHIDGWSIHESQNASI